MIFACGQLVFCQVLQRDGCQSTCGSSALLCVWLFSCWWLSLWVSRRNGTEIKKETDVEVPKSCLFTDLTVWSCYMTIIPLCCRWFVLRGHWHDSVWFGAMGFPSWDWCVAWFGKALWVDTTNFCNSYWLEVIHSFISEDESAWDGTDFFRGHWFMLFFH